MYVFSNYFKQRSLRVIAHRGACGSAPANTIVAFEQGLADGADTLEMDVHATSDGVLVVCHNLTVDETTDGVGAIPELSLAQILALDAGATWTDDGGKTFPFAGKGISMPTFEEVLQQFPDTPINVEIKGDKGDDTKKAVRLMFELLTKYDRRRDVCVAGNKAALVHDIRKAGPGVATSFSMPGTLVFWLLLKVKLGSLFNLSKASGPRAFEIPEVVGPLRVVTPKFVRSAHALGHQIFVWTVNDKESMHRLLDMGVDGIFTDFPSVLVAVIEERS